MRSTVFRLSADAADRRCFYYFLMAVIVIRYETTATARWTSPFIIRAFFNDTITVAVWTGFHVLTGCSTETGSDAGKVFFKASSSAFVAPALALATIFVKRLLLRSGDHSILRTPAPSCTLLPPTKQVEDRVFACASRADPRPIWAMSALPPKADMCSAQAYVCFGPIADSCNAAKGIAIRSRHRRWRERRQEW